eukprot:gb/GECH01013574.1/.p1 GENE.gb/GECH01013574.1/~~gb/GECH01013574.1/.p1  ORF type:complete len:114 (+),score=33.13 gb/GECH01013574.1/:1-342(+)
MWFNQKEEPESTQDKNYTRLNEPIQPFKLDWSFLFVSLSATPLWIFSGALSGLYGVYRELQNRAERAARIREKMAQRRNSNPFYKLNKYALENKKRIRKEWKEREKATGVKMD